ncbi:MAG: DUF2249 domain-containing protein [Rubrivivax sp.]|nr:DUF2249 domain-containing protein [Rubrivivax sp.]MDP3611257.1 DUF2249 domain-containing protein [Rubrivivax sp.]
MAIATELIDVRTIAPAQRHPLIFGTFDGLAPGESFELLNDHDPVPLYMQFEKTRGGQFAWQYLQSGPARWHVRLSRIAAGTAGGTTLGCGGGGGGCGCGGG